MQNILDFYRVAQGRDFSRDFMMRVRSIGDTDGVASAFNEDDFVYITTKSLPDRQIENHEVPFFGLKFNLPGTATFPGSDGWEVKFWNDQNGSIRSRLETWQYDIWSEQTSLGDINLPGPGHAIQLDLVGEGGDSNVLNTYMLYGCYIRNLGAVEYDIQGTGAPTSFTAKLAYQFWAHTVVAPAVTSNATV